MSPNKGSQKKSVKAKTAAGENAHIMRSFIVTFAFAILVIYLIVTTVSTFMKINDTKEKIAVAKSQYDELVEQNDSLNNLLKNADENDIVERIARERLGYVFPDEKIYYDVN